MLTWLYVPGDRPDRFDKAVGTGTDMVILDLEDAVAPGRKAYASQAVADYLAETHGVPCEVRVNGPKDAEALLGLPGLAGLCVPKIETTDQIREYTHLAPGVPLHVLVETAVGIENLTSILAAAPEVADVALGEADLGSDLGITDEAGFAWVRGRLVIAARAARLRPPAMSVYPRLHDDEGLRHSCLAGRRLGMRGRAAIHPQQISIIIDAFRPTALELAHAQEVVDAFARDGTEGVIVLSGGRFADKAMLGAAQDILTLGARYGTVTI